MTSLFPPIYISQMQVFGGSITLNHNYAQVLRDKKKEPAMFCSANFARLPRNSKQFSVVQTGREDK